VVASAETGLHHTDAPSTSGSRRAQESPRSNNWLPWGGTAGLQDEALGLSTCSTQPHEFSDQEKGLLTLVGNQLGAASENARLYGELRSQIDRLTVLYELSSS